MSNDKFDPVAWWDRHFPNTPLSESLIRALAAEAAKQQARRDAEICRTQSAEPECPERAEYCAQAIEREAKLD